MGFLHDGHLSLIREAKRRNDIVIVSIFVNPTQFSPTEDLDRYPRDPEGDAAKAASAGADLLFVPSVSEMYPEGFSTFVQVEGLSSVLEGKFRPTHFRGVSTVVLKLFNIVQPDAAYFGQKDAQQCAVIRAMVKDLAVPVEIVIIPTMREADGLAMSSRNVYLSKEQRAAAPVLHRALHFAQQRIAAGEKDPEAIIHAMRGIITSAYPAEIDYIEIVGASDLQRRTVLKSGESVLIPLAARFGTTRLIDNITITIP